MLIELTCPGGFYIYILDMLLEFWDLVIDPDRSESV